MIKHKMDSGVDFLSRELFPEKIDITTAPWTYLLAEEDGQLGNHNFSDCAI
ncbi:MAG: hypothetical protein ACI8Y7_001112 [Candidatus Woesearchaeota archaeon]|jgi:hypothetical protein